MGMTNGSNNRNGNSVFKNDGNNVTRGIKFLIFKIYVQILNKKKGSFGGENFEKTQRFEKSFGN